jgi:hypothetical protein
MRPKATRVRGLKLLGYAAGAAAAPHASAADLRCYGSVLADLRRYDEAAAVLAAALATAPAGGALRRY